MTGVILCGGKSSRMGTDKGMIKSQESNWAKLTANLFITLNLPFFVSINQMQKANYEKAFESKQLIPDDPMLNVRGPLRGLLSFHKTYPNEDILVLACDMVEMKLPPLQLLVDNYLNHSGFKVYLFKTGDTFQPLCTVYTAAFLNNIFSRLLDGNLKKFGLTSLIEGSNKLIITAPSDWIIYFNNFNSPEDLSDLHR